MSRVGGVPAWERATPALIVIEISPLGRGMAFDSITWETGDASEGTNGFGGVPAAAGYSAGDGDSAHALVAPGSFTAGGLLDSNPATSLAGHSAGSQQPGRYVFQLRQGQPTGARLTGIVTRPDDQPEPNALVQACRAGWANRLHQVSSW